jgi:hypothetical protein
VRREALPGIKWAPLPPTSLQNCLADVMLLRSIRIDGKQLQDGYAIRLDNTLPKRDPRDRDPGVSGCK